MLPRIRIQYLNGQLGTVGESADGLVAIVCGAMAVAATFQLDKAYTLYKLEDLTDLGVTETNNARLWKHVSDFYNEAEEGTKLIVMGIAQTTKLEVACLYSNSVLRDLITQQNGVLRGIFLGGTNASDADEDFSLATVATNAQQLAEWATTTLYAPLFVCIGLAYDADLPDLSSAAYNRICVVVGDTSASSINACVGSVAGRVASIPVHRNIGRVRDGALRPTTMYVGENRVEESLGVINTLYDKRYITPRTHVGRSGYFLTDDNMAVPMTDDYAQLANRRVIDKAYRIAYNTLLDYLLDDIELNEDGTMQFTVLKSWQQAVEDAINASMTANGELSQTDGEGCKCYIDPAQNVVATSKIELTLKVRPHGYARSIDVNLGFLVASGN